MDEKPEETTGPAPVDEKTTELTGDLELARTTIADLGGPASAADSGSANGAVETLPGPLEAEKALADQAAKLQAAKAAAEAAEAEEVARAQEAERVRVQQEIDARTVTLPDGGILVHQASTPDEPTEEDRAEADRHNARIEGEAALVRGFLAGARESAEVRAQFLEFLADPASKYNADARLIASKIPWKAKHDVSLGNWKRAKVGEALPALGVDDLIGLLKQDAIEPDLGA